MGNCHTKVESDVGELCSVLEVVSDARAKKFLESLDLENYRKIKNNCDTGNRYDPFPTLRKLVSNNDLESKITVNNLKLENDQIRKELTNLRHQVKILPGGIEYLKSKQHFEDLQTIVVKQKEETKSLEEDSKIPI